MTIECKNDGPIKKDPADNVDYSVVWTDELAPRDDFIIASEWYCVPSDNIIVGVTSFDSFTTTAWVSGGTVNYDYRLVNRIQTNAGRVQERSRVLQIRNV